MDIEKKERGGTLSHERHGVSFRDAFWVWVRVAALSFGGPAGQIAVMHRILVEEKRWISETRFLHALNYCTLVPGPEAHKLAVYIGWLLHRTRGGLVAGLLFIFPGLIALGILSWIYATYGSVGYVQAFFFGLKAAVLAVVLEAVLRVGRRALKTQLMVTVAALSFVAIFIFAVPFPVVILAAALMGLIGNWSGRMAPRNAANSDASTNADATPAAIDAAFDIEIPEHVRPSTTRAIKVSLIGLLLWLGPLFALLGATGPDSVFTHIATFFSKMAVLTFGGAYAILSYVAQQAVDHYHWLAPGEMLAGLGMAETTPGPLISVVQFVGFMAAFRQPGALDPALAGTLGGVLAKWATFAPSFLFIFIGAPYVEAVRHNRALNVVLSTIMAAVVGVILNLAVWFALHTLFAEINVLRVWGMTLQVPVLSSLDPWSLLLSAAAVLALFRFHLGMMSTLAGCCIAGIAIHVLT
ncbi:MAG: chromate efflux transporter [Herbaspirillum huttiense]|uniref:chromate efflux transporter n=1 Tax=Herbaspirillum huttiense TaxID=863372 RepID=UPI001AD0D2D1|nr:chromate efflux transporter [Herbaspirillum huttiense]MBN9357391.1 chromate efflux transporter [Herbaspirillum huttiense]